MRGKLIALTLTAMLAIIVLPQTAAAGTIVVGDIVTIDQATNHSLSGGEFIMNKVSGTGSDYPFHTFCVETGQYIVPDNTTQYRIAGLSSVNSSADYLFSLFAQNLLPGYTHTSAQQDALQNVIWYFMGQGGSITNPDEVTYYNLAKNATGHYGTERVTLETLQGGNAQDMLHWTQSVPEPSMLILLGLGLSLTGIIARKRAS